VLDSNVAEAMDVLSDIVTHATFKEQELEKEKLVVIEELRNAEDDPEDIIHDYFEKALFPEHALGFPIIGTEKNLRSFSREDLFSHVKAHYQPSRIVVAAAGNVDHDRLVKLAAKNFDQATRRSTQKIRPPGPTRVTRPLKKEYPRPISQAHICMGTVGYSIHHKDRFPLMLLNALLGEGMSSRLYQTIREKHGFAYSVYSFVNLLSDTGLFGAYIGTDKKNIVNSISLVHKELRRLKKTPVSKAELGRTQAQIKGTMMLGLENMSSRMMRLGSSELYYRKSITLNSVLKKVDAVTPEQIQKVAVDLFDLNRFSTVIIRPS
jgi:predicted Zn-dependent peptidase